IWPRGRGWYTLGTMGMRIGDDMGLDVAGTLCFQLGGARHSMTWRQFILALGLHTTKEMVEDGFASGPKRQQVAVTGMFEAVEDAPIVDKGAQTDPTLILAPHPRPPPLAAGRTMP
nr:hypothetical protein [Tanacetum cinerariifolium]